MMPSPLSIGVANAPTFAIAATVVAEKALEHATE